MHHPIASADFSKKTLKALAAQGIFVVGIQMVPGTGPMPMANVTKAYCLDDNGTHKVRSLMEVIAASK